MYKFAYLYVRLGYLLAAVVLGVGFFFVGGAIVALEAQKPRVPASFFNDRVAKIQNGIIAQTDLIQRVFALDQSLPALKSLRSRKWGATYISPSAATRLEREYDASADDIDSLREAVVGQLHNSVDFIIGKLAPSDSTPQSEPGDTSYSPNFSELPELASSKDFSQEVYASDSGTISFNERIASCNDALVLVATLRTEAKNSENKAALGRANSEIESFLAVIRQQKTLLERQPSQEVAAQLQSASPQVPNEPKRSRKDDVREDLLAMLKEVEAAVTQGWSLDVSLQKIEHELQVFRAEADLNGRVSAGLFNFQMGLVGVLLGLVVLAFFIAVGSDLVKAILDSAVWLSHIYANTASGHASGIDGEQDQ